MKKVLKFLLIVIVLVVGAGLGIGFMSDPAFETRNTFVIDAPVAKVWSVVSDPKAVLKWMPPHSADETLVEVKMPADTEKKPARHTYVQKNGKSFTVEVEANEPNKRYMEHVVQEDTGMSSMFPDVSWGFELAEAEGGKTQLTPVMRGRAAKPHGTLLSRVLAWTGAMKGQQETMAKNIEGLAKQSPAK